MWWTKWRKLVAIDETTLDIEFKLGAEGNSNGEWDEPTGGKMVGLPRTVRPKPGYAHHTHFVQKRFNLPKYISPDLRRNRQTLQHLF